MKAQSSPASAAASATIITEMAGAEKLDDISFTTDVNSSTAKICITCVNIIGTGYDHSITVSSKNVVLKKDGEEDLILQNVEATVNNGQLTQLTASFNFTKKQSPGVYLSSSPLNVIINYN